MNFPIFSSVSGIIFPLIRLIFLILPSRFLPIPAFALSLSPIYLSWLQVSTSPLYMSRQKNARPLYRCFLRCPRCIRWMKETAPLRNMDRLSRSKVSGPRISLIHRAGIFVFFFFYLFTHKITFRIIIRIIRTCLKKRIRCQDELEK